MADILIDQVARRWPEVHRYRNEVWKILPRNFLQAHVPADSYIFDDEGITSLNRDCTTECPMLDDSLDVIFTSNCFEYLPTKQAVVLALKQVRRCLKPAAGSFVSVQTSDICRASIGRRRAFAPLFFVRPYLGFPPAWRVMGKQFLIVARRRSRPAADGGV